MCYCVHLCCFRFFLNNSAVIFVFPTMFFLHLLYACKITPLRTYNAPWFYKFFSDLAVLCVSILMLGDYFCFPSFPSSPRKPCFWCVTEVGSSLMILAQFRPDSSLLFDSHVVFQLLRSLNFFVVMENSARGSLLFLLPSFDICFSMQHHSIVLWLTCVVLVSSSWKLFCEDWTILL